MAEISVNIENLELDLENPRFSGFQSSREALEAIIVDQGNKLLELAKDISIAGLSPTNRILVSPSQKPNIYTVLDGNRRLAALKILINPAFLDSIDGISTLLKKQYKVLAAEFEKNTVEPINVALVDSRDSANRWIDLIHTGENKGKGVVAWDGVATDRFRGKSPSYQVLQLLKKAGNINDEFIEKFPITNLGRLLSTPEVREALGVSIVDGSPSLLYKTDQVLPLLSEVVEELGSGRTTVSDIKSKDDRIAFIGKFTKAKKLKKNKPLSVPLSITDAFGSIATKRAELSRSRTVTTRVILNRNNLIPSKCKLAINIPKINSIVNELRKLNLDLTPNAVAVLLRVFLELSMDEYAKKHRLAGYNADTTTLAAKLLKVADHLQENGMTKNELNTFRRAANNNTSSFNVDRLHKFVHGTTSLPTASELRSGWDEVQHVFERIWE